MNRQVSLALGMCCLIATAVLGYVAYDSYQTEVNKGRPARDRIGAAKELFDGGPVGRFLEDVDKGMEPTTPTTTKVCGAISVGTGVAGLMFLILAASPKKSSPPPA